MVTLLLTGIRAKHPRRSARSESHSSINEIETCPESSLSYRAHDASAFLDSRIRMEQDDEGPLDGARGGSDGEEEDGDEPGVWRAEAGRDPVRVEIFGRTVDIRLMDGELIPDIEDDNDEYTLWTVKLVEDWLEYLDKEDRLNCDPFPLLWIFAVRQRNVSESHFESVLEMARSSRRSSVQLEPSEVEDQCAARRTMQLVGRLRNLEHMGILDVFGSPVLAERVNLLLKEFVSRKRTSAAFASGLSSFEFHCGCDVSPILLLQFFESTASSLVKIVLGSHESSLSDLDEDLARSLSMAFGRLPHLEQVDIFPAFSSDVLDIIEGLSAAPSLQQLCLGLVESTSGRKPSKSKAREIMRGIVTSVASLAALSTTLRALKFDSAIDSPQCDASQIMVQAAQSTSLERLCFQGVSIRFNEPAIRRERHRNEKVRSIEFVHCKLGEGVFEVLSSCFKGIESMQTRGCSGLERVRIWRRFFTSNPHVKTFSAESGYDRPGVARESILQSIVQTGHAFDSLSLDLGGDFNCYTDRLFPSLQTLLGTTTEKLVLTLESNDSDTFLFAGIEGATRLENLILEHNMAPPDFARLLKAIQSNRSLRSFTCSIRLPEGVAVLDAVEECASGLVDLLRYNSRLNRLGVDIHSTDFRDCTPLLWPFANEGLRFNRSIVYLQLSRHAPLIAESGASASLSEVLELHNTVLQRIEGLERAPMEVRKPIEAYLWRNRSGRHFVRNVNLVTPGLFPHILCAISKDTGADGLRYFLKHLPAERLVRLLSSRGRVRSRPRVV